MKKTTIITILAFVLGVLLLAGGFILLTENNISDKLFATTTTTTTTIPPTTSDDSIPEYKEFNFFEENISEWITLGQYKGLQVEVPQTKITEADIDMQIHIIVCQNDCHSKEFEGKITQKSIFNFDYKGYLLNADGTRGEAFEGGSSTNQLAYIDGNDFVTVSSTGLGSFIDGFAQGMIGMSVGETKTLDITFPEVYENNTSLAGKKVEFDVTVNYIANTVLNNGLVSKITNQQYTTISEYRQFLREDLQAALDEQNNQAIVLAILNNATLVATEEKQNEYVFGTLCANVAGYVEMYASYGMPVSFVDMLKQLTGFNSVEEFREYSANYAKSAQGQLAIKSSVLYHAIIEAEKFEITDEEYNEVLGQLCENMGMTAEALYEEFTEEFVRNYIEENILLEKAYAFVYENNSYVEKK